MPAGSSGVTSAMNNFAFDFFKNTLNNDGTVTNKLVSPFSIYIALSMVYNGANNATRDSIAHALRLTSDDVQKLNDVCKVLIEDLPGVDSKVKLSIANSIWYNKSGAQPIENFLIVTNQWYHAAVTPTDFSNSESSLNAINEWVADNTNQKILKILDKVSKEDLMYLVNAVYFKGTWRNKFDASKTTNENFHTVDGSSVSVPFMIQENKVHFVHDEKVQVLELPYSSGSYNMYILLPQENTTLDQVISSINTTSFHQLLSDTLTTNMTIHLPKWKSNYKMGTLRPELAAMGMDISFTDFADFTKMYNQPVQITKSIHQTFIEVNEEGTEAAAATVIGTGLTSIGPPAVLRIDRPFMYVIAEKTSGVILFTGVVNNPALN